MNFGNCNLKNTMKIFIRKTYLLLYLLLVQRFLSDVISALIYYLNYLQFNLMVFFLNKITCVFLVGIPVRVPIFRLRLFYFKNIGLLCNN